MITSGRYAGARIPHGVVEVTSAWSRTPPIGDLSTWSFSNGDRTAVVVSGSGVRAIRGTLGLSSGKRYFEILKTTSGSFGTGVRDEYGLGNINGGGTAAGGVAYRRGGVIVQGSTLVLGVPALVDGDIAAIAVNLDTGVYWFSRNGVWVQGDPSTGTSPIGTLTTGVTRYPGTSSETPSPCNVTLNSRRSEFTYPIPAGFKSWAQV